MVSCVADRPVNKGLYFFFQYSGHSQFGGQTLVLEMLWSYRESLEVNLNNEKALIINNNVPSEIRILMLLDLE